MIIHCGLVVLYGDIYLGQLWRDPGSLWNIRYPSEIHLKLKSREISFAHNPCFSWPITLKFCTEHGSITAMLCAKFQTDWTIETDVMDGQVFARFEFKMSLGRISYIAQYPMKPFQYCMRHLVVWTCIISKLQGWLIICHDCIALKFDRHFSSSAAKSSVRF